MEVSGKSVELAAVRTPAGGAGADAGGCRSDASAAWFGLVLRTATAQQRPGDARQVQPADRYCARAPGQADRARQEAARSSRGEPPDWPPAAAQPARRGPVRDRVAVRRQPGRLLPAGRASTPCFDDWAALSEGTYLLRSNIADWSDRQLWKAYIQLTQVEAAFRIQKEQLTVRPAWHQREDRVQAHILVCFLTLVLWKVSGDVAVAVPASATRRAPSSRNWRTSSRTTWCCQQQPTALIRLRAAFTQPDAAQAALLDRLGLGAAQRTEMRLKAAGAARALRPSVPEPRPKM